MIRDGRKSVSGIHDSDSEQIHTWAPGIHNSDSEQIHSWVSGVHNSNSEFRTDLHLGYGAVECRVRIYVLWRCGVDIQY